MRVNNVSCEETQAYHQLSSSSYTLLISTRERNKKTPEHPFKSVYLNCIHEPSSLDKKKSHLCIQYAKPPGRDLV